MTKKKVKYKKGEIYGFFLYLLIFDSQNKSCLKLQPDLMVSLLTRLNRPVSFNVIFLSSFDLILPICIRFNINEFFIVTFTSSKDNKCSERNSDQEMNYMYIYTYINRYRGESEVNAVPLTSGLFQFNIKMVLSIKVFAYISLKRGGGGGSL